MARTLDPVISFANGGLIVAQNTPDNLPKQMPGSFSCCYSVFFEIFTDVDWVLGVISGPGAVHEFSFSWSINHIFPIWLMFWAPISTYFNIPSGCNNILPTFKKNFSRFCDTPPNSLGNPISYVLMLYIVAWLLLGVLGSFNTVVTCVTFFESLIFINMLW